MVIPTLATARALGWLDRRGIDGAVDGAAWLTARLSRLEGAFDRMAVGRVVGLVASGVYEAGDRGRRLQARHIRGYLMGLAVGVVGLFAFLFAWIKA